MSISVGNKNCRNVLYCLADHSGCGYIRTIFPNEYLNNIYGNKQKYLGIVTSRFILDKIFLSKLHYLRFQRQITNEQLKFMQIFKDIKEKDKDLTYKIIYDLDDLLTEVPSYNYANVYYNSSFIRENLKKITNIVDIFTVSTYPLKKAIEELGGTCKVVIIPNYIPKYLYKPYSFAKKENSKPKVLWAGSATHFSDTDPGDFRLIKDLINNTVDEFDWVFMGIKQFPKWISHLQGKIRLVPWCSLFELSGKIKEINADFGLAPLLDNRFNIVKSNIKLLDYLSADILPITSNLKPYEDNKTFLTNDWKTDRDQIVNLFLDKQKYNDIMDKQQRYLNRYWLETNTKDYEDLFEIKK